MGSASPDDGHDDEHDDGQDGGEHDDGQDSEHGGCCESCGDDGVELTLVRRVYVTPETWDQAGRVERGDLEWWCDVCRTHYPHLETTAEAAAGDGPAART